MCEVVSNWFPRPRKPQNALRLCLPLFKWESFWDPWERTSSCDSKWKMWGLKQWPYVNFRLEETQIHCKGYCEACWRQPCCHKPCKISGFFFTAGCFFRWLPTPLLPLPRDLALRSREVTACVPCCHSEQVRTKCWQWDKSEIRWVCKQTGKYGNHAMREGIKKEQLSLSWVSCWDPVLAGQHQVCGSLLVMTTFTLLGCVGFCHWRLQLDLWNGHWKMWSPSFTISSYFQINDWCY